MKIKDQSIKSSFSINLIYWIINSLLWILILGLLVISIEILFMSIRSDSNSFSKLGINLPLNVLENGIIELNGAANHVKVYEINGVVNIWDLGILTKTIYFGSTFIVGCIIIYALSLLKKMIINVKSNNVFTSINVIYLKRVAYLFFATWFIIDIVLRLAKQLLYAPSQTSLHISTDYIFSTYLIIGAIILAIAHIFEQGVKLQEYKNLTI